MLSVSTDQEESQQILIMSIHGQTVWKVVLIAFLPARQLLKLGLKYTVSE